MTGKITVQCVSCKSKETLTVAQAQTGDGLCSKCRMPCVIVSASLSSRRSKRDLREVFR